MLLVKKMLVFSEHRFLMSIKLQRYYRKSIIILYCPPTNIDHADGDYKTVGRSLISKCQKIEGQR